ncbi:MAG: DUF1616 domain-containing protein [Methanobacterium sp.]
MKRLYQTDILIVTLLAIFCLVAVVTSELNNIYIRIVFEYSMILFLPGYALTTFIFPRNKDLKIMKRLVLSFLFSIAITLFFSLILIIITSETILTSILIFNSLFVLVIQPASLFRRKQVSEKFDYDLTEFLKSSKLSFKAKFQRDKVNSVILVIFIVLIVSMATYVILSPKNDENYTEFYILGSGGNAYNYPTNLTVNQTGIVYVGIVNHEGSNVTYEMKVRLNNNKLSTQNITLQKNEQREIPYSFMVTNPGQNQKLEFFLYKLPDGKNVYRYLSLQIDVHS